MFWVWARLCVRPCTGQGQAIALAISRWSKIVAYAPTRTRVRNVCYNFCAMREETVFEPRPIEEIIRSAFDDINLKQMEIFARMTPAERAQIMFDLIEFQRQKMYAFEKQRAPDATEEELWKRVRRRIELSYDEPTIQRLRKYNYPFA